MMCEFCSFRGNIVDIENTINDTVLYCPICGDSLMEMNEYFISLNGGEEAYWIEDLDEASDPETIGYILSHASQHYLETGLPVYRATLVGEIQGYPKFVKH